MGVPDSISSIVYGDPACSCMLATLPKRHIFACLTANGSEASENVSVWADAGRRGQAFWVINGGTTREYIAYRLLPS
eukprot:2938039-Rhodomonas_salina.1